MLQIIKPSTIKEETTWAIIDAQLNKLSLEFVENALWHIDNAGAVLISATCFLDPRPVKDRGPLAPDTSAAIIPVPLGHKVVLQR